MRAPNYLLRPLRPLSRTFRRPPPGSSPGSVLNEPSHDARLPRITALAYGPDGYVEEEIVSIEQIHALRGRFPVLWLDVDGVSHVETIRQLGEIFGLHRLALEDVINVPQRPKVEDYADVLFIVTRSAAYEKELETEQMAIFLGPDFVLTFQERPGDPLGPVRARIRSNTGRIRSAGPDYLAYAVVDAIYDHFFPVLEKIGDQLDRLEAKIFAGHARSVMADLYSLKRDLADLRRALWPARDALASLVRDDHRRFDAETRVHLRDCHDHAVQSIDLLESYRDLTSSLTDLYLSVVGQRTNETMKVLTIFSAIFIPLTFIAGVYGMNFDPDASPLNMPELRSAWGYPGVLAFMGAVAVGMLWQFRRRGWLGGEPKAKPID